MTNFRWRKSTVPPVGHFHSPERVRIAPSLARHATLSAMLSPFGSVPAVVVRRSWLAPDGSADVLLRFEALFDPARARPASAWTPTAYLRGTLTANSISFRTWHFRVQGVVSSGPARVDFTFALCRRDQIMCVLTPGLAIVFAVLGGPAVLAFLCGYWGTMVTLLNAHSEFRGLAAILRRTSRAEAVPNGWAGFGEWLAGNLLAIGIGFGSLLAPLLVFAAVTRFLRWELVP